MFIKEKVFNPVGKWFKKIQNFNLITAIKIKNQPYGILTYWIHSISFPIPPRLCLLPTTQFQFIWIYPAILLTKGDNTVHWAQTHSSRSKDPSELVLRGMLNGLRDFLGTRHAHPDLVSVLILHKPRWGSWNISEITGIGISSSWFEGHTLYSRGLDGHGHFYTILVSLKKRVLYEDIWQILKFQS